MKSNKEKLEEYYGTAACSLGPNNIGPLAELINIDNLSEEEIEELVKELGLDED